MTFIPVRLSPENADKIRRRTVTLTEWLNNLPVYDDAPFDREYAHAVETIDQCVTDMVQLCCYIKYLENLVRSFTGERPANIDAGIDPDDFADYLNSMQKSVANVEVIR